MKLDRSAPRVKPVNQLLATYIEMNLRQRRGLYGVSRLRRTSESSSPPTTYPFHFLCAWSRSDSRGSHPLLILRVRRELFRPSKGVQSSGDEAPAADGTNQSERRSPTLAPMRVYAASEPCSPRARSLRLQVNISPVAPLAACHPDISLHGRSIMFETCRMKGDTPSTPLRTH